MKRLTTEYHRSEESRKSKIASCSLFGREPTAALDPIAEAEVYENFNRIAEDKTTVFISHRLSSCRFCDTIAVFDRGAIVQIGSHEALVADVNGKYNALRLAQAQYYTEG